MIAADTLSLDKKDLAAFARDGAVCLRGAFDRSWLERVAQGVRREMAAPCGLAKDYTADGQPGRYFGSLVMWRGVPEFEGFVLHSPAAAIAGAFMDADTVLFYHDHLLVKEPGTNDPTPWHHDQSYYPVDGEQIVSIWMPLDPVDRATAVEFIAGSHRWGRWFAPRYFATGDNYYGLGGTRFEDIPDFGAERENYRILGWAMEPGDAIVFHALTVHGAPGNHSANRRRAYATRWLGEDARYASRPGEISPPIEGHGLAPGDPMECESFPVVWRRGGLGKQDRESAG
ncbi:MAG: phytanoyl-CoA dioxygenase family protein [Alphaproteobacteria bacterium]